MSIKQLLMRLIGRGASAKVDYVQLDRFESLVQSVNELIARVNLMAEDMEKTDKQVEATRKKVYRDGDGEQAQAVEQPVDNQAHIEPGAEITLETAKRMGLIL